ncbi:gamma-aminobutyrate transaminase POP2 [Cucumis melo var. makuwa]|uniref:Gamma-aminobutyrate transaminase POP2 n=1 Tax=Cucumis melo var. makuwa TaxID=1194695 RepID=A0A5D3CA08_CUCMM|nr:gamma-aminobutyrate transaminase POP2 [Cucumis melo var. makuwa]TYK08345.1 gamma-aminobutyrate transaminase POP2 [Cucumis melo var. makuwa]
MDVMFLEFVEDLDNPAGGSWLVNDNLAGISQPFATLTPSCLKWADIDREYIEAVKGNVQVRLASDA